MTDYREPRTVTELRRDLRAGTARCERRVYVGSFARLSGRVDVVGPPTASGHALVVYLRTGMTRLNVTGGRVHVVATSGWGNSIDIAADAAEFVTVDVPFGDVKVTIDGPIPPANLTGELRRTRWHGKVYPPIDFS